VNAIPYQYDPEHGLFQIGDASAGIAESTSFAGMVQIAFASDGGISAVQIIADNPEVARTRAVLNDPIPPTI